MAWELTAATPAHAAAMAAVQAVSLPPAEQWSADLLATHLACPATLGGVALGGMVIGRVCAGEAELYTVAVCPAWRRHGLGRALVRQFLAWTHGAGASSCFLEVSPANAAARALYVGLGFHQVGHRAAYYPDGGDALVLRHDRIRPP